MAAKTITQRIAFEGGQQMEIQLKQLGDAGTTAFTRIKAAADNASGFGARMTAAIETIRVRLNGVADAASKVASNFSTLEQRAGTVARRMITAQAAVVAVAIAIGVLAVNVGKATEEIENSAAAAGLATDKYQELQTAFQISGIDGDKFGTMMNRMNRTLGDAQKNAQKLRNEQTELGRQFSLGRINATQYMERLQEINRTADQEVTIFSRLGISAAQFGNDSEAALRGLIEALSQLPKGIQRSALELEIFGRTGTRVDAIVEKGARGIDELVKEAQRVAPALTKAQLAVGNALDDSFDKLKLAAKNTQQQFVLTFGPVMTTLVEGLTEVVIRNRETILAFGAAMAERIRPVVEDIVRLLNGETVDPNGLVGRVSGAVLQFAADARAAIGIVVAAWLGFVAILETIAGLINRVFGTNLTGQALAIVAVIGLVTGAFSALAAVVTTLISVIGLLDAALVLVFGPQAALLIGLALMGAAIGYLIAQIPAVQQAFNALVEGFNGTVQNFITLFQLIGAAWSLLWQEAGNVARSVLGSVGGFLDSILAKIRAAIAAMKSFFSASGGGSGEGTPGYASGGKVRGPGTSRSDSILARLSNGEFVQQAPAVSYYGERFMSALNNMRIPRSVLDGITGFANGGAVSAASSLMGVPGYATGGLVTADALAGGASKGRPLVLQIGDEMFTGMTAEDKTAEKLSRFATRRNIQSAGRKPSWVK